MKYSFLILPAIAVISIFFILGILAYDEYAWRSKTRAHWEIQEIKHKEEIRKLCISIQGWQVKMKKEYATHDRMLPGWKTRCQPHNISIEG